MGKLGPFISTRKAPFDYDVAKKIRFSDPAAIDSTASSSVSEKKKFFFFFFQTFFYRLTRKGNRDKHRSNGKKRDILYLRLSVRDGWMDRVSGRIRPPSLTHAPASPSHMKSF